AGRRANPSRWERAYFLLLSLDTPVQSATLCRTHAHCYRCLKLLEGAMKFFCMMILPFVFSSPSALAQSPSTGAQLIGTILDPNGAVIPGASVTLRSEITAIEQSTTSDAR